MVLAIACHAWGNRLAIADGRRGARCGCDGVEEGRGVDGCGVSGTRVQEVNRDGHWSSRSVVIDDDGDVGMVPKES